MVNGMKSLALSLRESQGEIPVDDVEFHPLSFGDAGGRLFVWEQQLYRAISRDRADLCMKLFQDGIVERLVKQGLLVETEPTVLRIRDYPLVLRHRLLPFVSYAYEWCGPMLQDAALLVLDFELQLSQFGLTLQDAHPWNVVFDGARPLYVDFNSIVRAEELSSWRALEEFRQFFLRPLKLMASGHGRIARWLLHDCDTGILQSEVETLTQGPAVWHLKNRARRLASIVRQHTPSVVRKLVREMMPWGPGWSPHFAADHRGYRVFLERLRRQVEDIEFPRTRTQWSDYYSEHFPPFSPSGVWTSKQRAVHSALEDLRPASVLDVGCNRGWFSQLAARRGAAVVAIDADEICVSDLFRDAKAEVLSLLPLVMDFRNASLGFGDRCGVPVTQRLRCEMVMGLALVHHLVFGQGLDFDKIIDGLSTFANKWLLVEFIPPEDAYVRNWMPNARPWYTFGRFEQGLRRHYRLVRAMPSSPAPRVLLLCEK
jgi:SAM-dependent methyltransferase